MNVYDFDNTIFRGDSTTRFFFWCLRRFPGARQDWPGQLANAILFVLRLKPKQAFKQRMFQFLRAVPDVERALDAFWAENYLRVKAWYPQKHRPDDVVISASPDWLIAPACRKLGISAIMGSPVRMDTGLYYGPNCHGAEKVRRFRAAFPQGEIDEFFSDSHSDDPLAALAKRAWLVKGERLLPWDESRA